MHEHDPICVDNVIKCRTCGENIPQMSLATVQSAVQARRILDEIAAAGEYKIASSDGDFPVYSEDNGLEITVNKLADRRFDVVKRSKK